MAIQSMAYWHQYDRASGRQSSGPRAPLERLALAVVAASSGSLPQLVFLGCDCVHGALRGPEDDVPPVRAGRRGCRGVELYCEPPVARQFIAAYRLPLSVWCTDETGLPTVSSDGLTASLLCVAARKRRYRRRLERAAHVHTRLRYLPPHLSAGARLCPCVHQGGGRSVRSSESMWAVAVASANRRRSAAFRGLAEQIGHSYWQQSTADRQGLYLMDKAR